MMKSVPVASLYASRLSALSMRTEVVTVLGSSTKYWDYGPEDAPLTVVFVHGFRGEHHGLELVAAQLEGIRIISPDLPGFGESMPFTGRPHDIPSYSAWLKEFLCATGQDSAILVGHSFGSVIVSSAVADGLRPERVVLINPIASAAFRSSKSVMNRLTLLYYHLGQALPERIGRAFLSSWFIVRFISVYLTRSSDRSLRSWIHDQHHRYFNRFSTRSSLLEGFEASISSDVSVFAQAVSVPTLLIAAADDPISTIAAQNQLVELFSDARLVILPDVGHLVHYEKPHEAAQAMVAFFGVGRVVTP